MKIVNKSDLTFDAATGTLFNKDGESIAVPDSIACGINQLEKMNQKAIYILENPVKANEVKPFSFESAFDREVDLGLEAVKTPTSDAVLEEAKKVMEENDAVNLNKAIEDLGKRFKDVVFFVEDKTVPVMETDYATQFDTKTIGNPLKMTKKQLIAIFKNIAEADAQKSSGTFFVNEEGKVDYKADSDGDTCCCCQ